MKFYLGTHLPAWLHRSPVPLFVSHRLLRRRVSPFPPAACSWALDSGGYTELALHGQWRTGRAAYITAVRRYSAELGRLDWAAPMDWLCTPDLLARTGRTVREHQQQTVDNYRLLMADAPDLPFIPVLQGWRPGDYLACLDLYREAGFDLRTAPLVGVGSIAGRQATGAVEDVLLALADAGLRRLHGFGVKTAGLARYGRLLASADSVSWSYAARRDTTRLPSCQHQSLDCRNCLDYAVSWRSAVLAAHAAPEQLSLAEPLASPANRG